MTTNDDLRRLAERAQRAANHFANLDRGDAAVPDAWSEWRGAMQDLKAALDPQTVLRLLDDHAALVAERDELKAAVDLHKDVGNMIRAERERLREALECWPLKELLADIEDSCTPESTKLMTKVRWFNEVRGAALAKDDAP